jgi:hypothetical protein
VIDDIDTMVNQRPRKSCARPRPRGFTDLGLGWVSEVEFDRKVHKARRR